MALRRSVIAIWCFALASLVLCFIIARADRRPTESALDTGAVGLASADSGTVRKAILHVYRHPQEYNDIVARALIRLVKKPAAPGTDDFQNQNAALQLLMSHHETSAVPTLIKRVEQDPSDSLAAFVLGEIGDEKAVDALIRLVEKRDHGQRSVYIALGKIGGEKALQFLVSRLSKDSGNWDLVEALGETRDKRAMESLLQLWRKHKEGALGMSYLVAIGKVSDERGLPLLLEASRSPDRWRRATAAEGLGRTHSKKALDRLAEMLAKEKDEQVWYGVTIGLAIYGGEEATKLLAEQLQKVTNEVIETMSRGQPMGKRWEDIDCLVKALAATRRASALVAIMDLIDSLHRFGAERYVKINRRDKTNAETCVLTVVWSFGRLRGRFDLIGGPGAGRFMRAGDAGERLSRILQRHLTCWEKEGKEIKELATMGKILPFAWPPEDPYLDSRRGGE